MRTIKIGFSKPKNKILPVFSWLIRLYEQIPYSHVYISWKTSGGQTVCYHAANTMIHFLGEEAFNSSVQPVEEYEITIDEENFDGLIEFCFKYCGFKYALKEVLKIPLYDLGILKPSVDNPRKQYCAELVARALFYINKEPIFSNYDRVKLKELNSYVKSKANTNGKT